MESVEQIRDRLLACFPRASISIIQNPSPSTQHSLLIAVDLFRSIAEWLRDDPALQFDRCSNVTGIDWPEKEIVETAKVTIADPAGGPAKVVEQKTKRVQPGYLEVVY